MCLASWVHRAASWIRFPAASPCHPDRDPPQGCDHNEASASRPGRGQLRKKELLRELFTQQPVSTGGAGLGVLATELAPVVGLDSEAALALLTEFAAEQPSVTT
jgi:hypothetical protein